MSKFNVTLIILLFSLGCFANPTLKPVFKQVAEEYSVSYDLLSKMAYIESKFDPNAKASTSSARGLFQILNSTELWLKEICDIEGDIFDPLTNTRLGACYIQHNTKYYKRKLGTEPSFTDLYILHFLGGYTGIKFIKLTKSKGSEIASKHFPKQAKANIGIFYKKGNTPRTLFEVMELFEYKVNKAEVL